MRLSGRALACSLLAGGAGAQLCVVALGDSTTAFRAQVEAVWSERLEASLGERGIAARVLRGPTARMRSPWTRTEPSPATCPPVHPSVMDRTLAFSQRRMGTSC